MQDGADNTGDVPEEARRLYVYKDDMELGLACD